MIKLDPRNANKGTERGEYMIEHSLRTYGAGRGPVADKHGVVIAGNKTVAKAMELGIPIQTIESDGKTLYVIQRSDLDLDHDPAAKELAIADNRSSEVGLEWDPDVLRSLADEVDLSAFWQDGELEALLAGLPGADDWADSIGGLPDGDKSPFQQMTFTVSDDQAEQIDRALTAAKGVGPFTDTGNENSNGNALARICETYLTHANR